MATDKNKGRVSTEQQVGPTAEEVQNMDATDDFDPFSGVIECVEENIDIVLSAPPENQWYHGQLDRNTAEDRLRQAGQLGSYLIRESDRKPGSYVLSFLGRTGVNHFRITAMCGDYYIGGREFDTLSVLIGYYTSWSDLLKGERLQHPVPPPVPVYDKRKCIAILPYTQIPDTDELSFDKGEIFVVHNDMGDGWLWVTSQSTGLSGIVNQELVQELNGNIDPVEGNEWYHGDITKQEATQKLARGGEGSWLVRPSDTTQGDYSLYFYCNTQIQRFKIQKHGRQYFMGGRYFDSIACIIERYKKEQIVEGYTLGSPVMRPRNNLLNEDSFGNKNRDIYATMRQSSGSNFFLNRKDHIVIKGYLNKKSQRTKKWKYMYFVLNGTEQQLYYFENEKRSKPKGLIDLNYSSLYPVHDSFFGRPNCFQLVLRALNHVSVYYICADNSDLAQNWTMALKPYCTNTQPKKIPKLMFPTITELRSLYITIFDARNLSVKQVGQRYCIVSLNEVKMCRTQVKEAPDLCWDEEFLLDDIPPDIESYTISIYNKGKRTQKKDTEIANTQVNLSDLQPGQTTDDWHILQAVNLTNKGDVGSMRIKARFLHEVIMPLKEYTSLKELLLAKNLETVLALSSVCTSSNDRIPLATSLLQIFRNERQEPHLLRTLNDIDMDKEGGESASTLFRGTTMATTLMDQYMKMTATAFVQTAVQGTINKIMESKQSCELNPACLENPMDAELNAKHLISILNETVNQIFQSTESCPMVLRYICGCLQKRVQTKWPNDPLVKTRVVSGFIFLRLLCLAILNPKQFNLITEAPSQMAVRTLKLVANSLIKLANLAEAKEPSMEFINPFIRDNKQRMVKFLDEFSNVPEVTTMTDCPAADLARSLATIHQVCVTHLDELQKLSQTKPFIKKLVTVTEMLTNHKKHYMGDA